MFNSELLKSLHTILPDFFLIGVLRWEELFFLGLAQGSLYFFGPIQKQTLFLQTKVVHRANYSR